jgi:hypothetical protein
MDNIFATMFFVQFIIAFNNMGGTPSPKSASGVEMPKIKNVVSDPLLSELINIKRLLVFSLLKDGASQKQIASALGVDQSQISRMFPAGIGSLTRGSK